VLASRVDDGGRRKGLELRVGGLISGKEETKLCLIREFAP